MVMMSRLSFACGLLGLALPSMASPGGSLPEVDAVMTKASDTLSDFAAQAKKMQEKVTQKQESSKAALAAQKNDYEQRLAAQADKEKEAVVANKQVRAAINVLQDSIDELKTHAGKIQRSNSIMREALLSLDPKMATARSFLEDSLKITDDSQAPELEILEAPKPEPSLKNFLAVTHDDFDVKQIAAENSQVVSLLSTGGAAEVAASTPPRRPQTSPEDLVRMLASGLEELERDQNAGEADLKAHFIVMFEQGEKRLAELAEERQSLEDSKAAKEALRGDLQVAKAHLMKTNQNLEKRLNGLRVFAQKADSGVLETLAKTQKLVGALATGPDDQAATKDGEKTPLKM